MKVRPEILAPAGDLDALQAALAAGANAVYLGLDDGFNARARAQNFGVDTLPDLVLRCHRAGARIYLTLNTLLFEPELEVMEGLLRKIAASGVDALIVQDPAVCLLAKAIASDLELHASTQMTISSPEGALFAKGLGVTRVVLPRELSVTEIGTFRALAPAVGVDDLETEVFVHGALCMSWSGQCLTSEAWGGRSANRGQCAQSCRLPYQLEVDGEKRNLEKDGDALRYFLSPKDLAAHQSVPALVELGVHTLKIEGRLKGPTYVQTAVKSFSRWLDHILAGEHEGQAARDELSRDLGDAHRVYSRGFSDGFLAGTDHQRLVDGRHPKNRGSFLGRVKTVDVHKGLVRVEPSADFPIFRLGEAPPVHTPPEAPLEPRRGMGIVFDAFDPENPKEPGGPIFDVSPDGAGWRLTFGNPGPDLSKVRPGHRVWVNSDPALESETRRLLQMAVTGRVPVDVTVSGRLGAPLRATFSSGRCTVSGETSSALVSSSGAGLDAAQLEGKLAAFGGTRFHLQGLTADLEGQLFIPPQALKALRRELVEQLERLLDAPPERHLPNEPMVPALRKRLRDAAARSLDFRAITSLAPPMKKSQPEPIALCRLPEQLEAAIALGLREVELDWMEMVGLGLAVERAKSAGMKVVIATTRVQKPGEEGFDKRIAKLAPDGVLARHWGALMHFSRKSDDIRPIVHGDFSLNVTNSLTALHLLGLGADTLTASHDLDEAQLLALLSEVPAHLVTVVLHHHIPTFHTEHCVYAHTLSDGTDYRNCGRPCEHRRVSLVDPKGLSHPVITDVGCRNTVFEARAQSAASLTPRLLEAGVERFRVELVRETFDETKTVLETYRALLRGEISPREAVRRVGVHEQFGVVRGVARSVVHAP